MPLQEYFKAKSLISLSVIFVKSNKLFILWLEPTIVVQGSQTGINPTTIRYSNAIFVDNCEWLKDVQFK